MKTVIGTLCVALGLAGPVLSRWVQGTGAAAQDPPVADGPQETPAPVQVPCPEEAPSPATPPSVVEPVTPPCEPSLAEVFGVVPAGAPVPALAAQEPKAPPATADETRTANVLEWLTSQSQDIDAQIAELEAEAAALEAKLAQSYAQDAQDEGAAAKELATRVDHLQALAREHLASPDDEITEEHWANLREIQDEQAEHVRELREEQAERLQEIQAEQQELAQEIQREQQERLQELQQEQQERLQEIQREQQERIQEMQAERQALMQDRQREQAELYARVQESLAQAGQGRQAAMEEANRSYQEAMTALQSEREAAAREREGAMRQANRSIEEAQRARETALRSAQEAYDQAVQQLSSNQERAAVEREHALRQAQRAYEQATQEAQRAREEAQRHTEKLQSDIQEQCEKALAEARDHRVLSEGEARRMLAEAMEQVETAGDLSSLQELGYLSQNGESGKAMREKLESALQALESRRAQLDGLDQQALADHLRAIEERMNDLSSKLGRGETMGAPVPPTPSPAPGQSGCCCCCCRGGSANVAPPAPAVHPVPPVPPSFDGGALFEKQKAIEKDKQKLEEKLQKLNREQVEKQKVYEEKLEKLDKLKGEYGVFQRKTTDDPGVSYWVPNTAVFPNQGSYSVSGEAGSYSFYGTPACASSECTEKCGQACHSGETKSAPSADPLAAPQSDPCCKSEAGAQPSPFVNVYVPPVSVPNFVWTYPKVDMKVDPFTWDASAFQPYSGTFEMPKWPDGQTWNYKFPDVTIPSSMFGTSDTAPEPAAEGSSSEGLLEDLLRLMQELKGEMQELRGDVRALRDDVKILNSKGPASDEARFVNWKTSRNAAR